MMNTEARNDKQHDVPTVSRVCGDTIVELVYDREKRDTALVVSRFGGLWNIERELVIATGERLVPYSPRNNLIVNDCVLLPTKPEECGHKHELIGDIERFLHRYLDLSPIFERIAAHYILLTWVYDAFAELPYLRLRGDYGTGKTRGLIAIGSVCYKPFFAAGASTVSPIFHTLDTFGGTLILDEADFRFSDATADLVKIFNNGTVRGLPVLRTVTNRHREFNPAAFKVFGPKIIAMRGSFEDAALESRFLTEETGTRPLRSDIPLHLPESLHREARELRNRLLHFRLCNLFSTKVDPALADRDLAPRFNQITLSLLSLIDDPELRRDIQGGLRQEHRRILHNRSLTLEAKVIGAVLEAFNGASQSSVSIGEIADKLNADQYLGFAPVSPRRVGSILRESLKIETRKSHGSYVVSLSDKAKVEAFAARHGVGYPQ